MTIFDCFYVFFPLVGGWYGFAWGNQQFGLAGGCAGAFLGAVSGFAVAVWLPLLVLKWVGFDRKSTPKLKAILAGDQYYIFHLALAELMARGEDVENEKPRILDLLISDQEDQRRFGWACLQLAFPDAASEIPDFSPQHPTDVHRDLIAKMRTE